MPDNNDIFSRLEQSGMVKAAGDHVATVTPINGRIPEIDHPLVRAALDRRLSDLAAMPPRSGRNAELNKAAAYLGTFPIPRPQLRELLLDACHANGVLAEDGESQCNNTISSGFKKADADGPRVIEDRHSSVVEVDAAEITPPQHRLQLVTSLEDIEGDFWSARSSLNLIYTAALSQMCSPWAVLACTTAQVLALTPPSIHLPAIIGGPGSLNWFAAIVAKSGGGKGAASAVAKQLIDGDDIVVRGAGSGEGMIEAYQRGGKGKEPPPPVTSVLFSVDEVDSLASLKDRSGQTTMAVIRQGFSGETLGYSYRGRAGESVAAHTYRMVMIVAVQPDRAGALFSDAGGGTPQRFMWFPGRDRRITADPPQWPTTKSGTPRVIPWLSMSDLARAAGPVRVPDEVVQTIRRARADSMSGDDNALDGHALFCREKFAFALALMDGRTEMNDEDWRLSGIASNVSDWCRDRAQSVLVTAQEQAARDRGRLLGISRDESDISAQIARNDDLRRVLRWAVGKIESTGGRMKNRELVQACFSRDRVRLADALKVGVDAGLIVHESGEWGLP